MHQQLATALLTRFEWLTEDRMVQRTTFEPSSGSVTITVNFSDQTRASLPPLSATVGGSMKFPKTLYLRTSN